MEIASFLAMAGGGKSLRASIDRGVLADKSGDL